MKTAVSVPDDVFERADRLARRSGLSRSEVYSRALREYVARHAPNNVVATIGDEGATFASEAGRRSLETVEW